MASPSLDAVFPTIVPAGVAGSKCIIYFRDAKDTDLAKATDVGAPRVLWDAPDGVVRVQFKCVEGKNVPFLRCRWCQDL